MAGSGNVFGKGKLGIKDDSKVLGMGGGVYAVTREDKGIGWNFGALLGGADE